MAQMGHPRFLLSGSRVRRMRDEERYSIDLVYARDAVEKACKMQEITAESGAAGVALPGRSC